MATSCSAMAISSGSHYKSPRGLCGAKQSTLGQSPMLTFQRRSNHLGAKRKLSVSAEYNDDSRGGGGDFVAGFVVGGAVFGALAYIFAPQIRRSILNEDEYGFQKARRPMYYDDGLENTRQTLNAKIRQLNSAIDNVSSRLRGGGKKVKEPIESDPEFEASL